MVIIEDRSLVELGPADDVDVVIACEAEAPEGRSRDAQGHCWDGMSCDHPDHGASGLVHLFR